MPNFLYTDAYGEQQGPFDLQQLQALADQGIITPDTLLRTDSGHQGAARQIPGLRFKVAAPSPSPSPFPQKSSRTYQQETPTYSSSNVGGTSKSVFSWLIDLTFLDIRVHNVNRMICSVTYVICCVAAMLGGLVMTFGLFYEISQKGVNTPIITFLAIPAVWLGVALIIFFTRLYCEICVIVLDWIVETTKAARIYIENNEKGAKQ